MRVIGLMSGTSYDAIDAAAADLTLDGDRLVLTPLGLITRGYDEGLRAALGAALPPAATTLAEVCRLDTDIGRAFAAAAVEADRELCDGRAELVASHGQTVFHWVEGGRVHGTLQIGQPAWIAEATGLPVVSDFRPRDIAAGGQGAPLVSLVDRMWLRGRPGSPAALNLGGIANITAADGTAFDTGPANALVDAAVHEATGGRLSYDLDGELAAQGTVDEGLLTRLLDEPYYALPAPKTTGKELFHLPYLRTALKGYEALSTEDVVATLTRLTARTVADAIRSVGASEVIASGGGTANPVLMRFLRAELGEGLPLRTSGELGLPSAAKEAYAFAVLGFLTLHGLPGTVPASTGARHASVLGSITPGRRGTQWPRATEGARGPVRLVVNGHEAAGR
ncbi:MULTISPECIES: anhydro-N-acetylmuramic acid kinase [Streptomyces]|uniref:Anhydro-N-acetylmuramic acid kinase n=2 Tax=Streptomyces TaxID=1883 RepID=A0A5P2BJ90_STRVZ|nr:anhydro-N-acetylmuramic acid kinase [Streptomyces venezuelae]MYY82860.1 anhydro-N-acetylmuramic acid kinase [Streptomyces sp. SID335]MYZ16762.1 anhydro-N-acetylmuramic acid kinase [Streptomyces sp. SID337]NEB43232.1 anhydro-N-acetylmuramic acid kinase [Streptomyces sp. SID339]QES30555.1 anhydro-N-acetylmuramic acid kinase [Streptomyces venezuelae]